MFMKKPLAVFHNLRLFLTFNPFLNAFFTFLLLFAITTAIVIADVACLKFLLAEPAILDQKGQSSSTGAATGGAFLTNSSYSPLAIKARTDS